MLKNVFTQDKQKAGIHIIAKAVCRSQLPRKKNYGSTPSPILGVIMDSKIKVVRGEMIELLVW